MHMGCDCNARDCACPIISGGVNQCGAPSVSTNASSVDDTLVLPRWPPSIREVQGKVVSICLQ